MSIVYLLDTNKINCNDCLVHIFPLTLIGEAMGKDSYCWITSLGRWAEMGMFEASFENGGWLDTPYLFLQSGAIRWLKGFPSDEFSI
jgi:hypothetical protein